MRGTPPRRSGARGRETPRQQAEPGGIRTGRSEVDADAGGLLDDAGADLEQALPEGGNSAQASAILRGTASRRASISQ